MRERPGSGVSPGERLAQVPLLPQRGDERRVAVLLVEHVALGYPGGDDDGRDPITRAVEGEAALARRCRRVGRGDRPEAERGRRCRPVRPSR